MSKRMLIDSTHAEETRVVVLDGNKLEDFDVETSTKKQIKGNIYLAKVIRVEPSLQAAFVEYGGNRHGFLAFSEIHPDYYQIPVADRERLMKIEADELRAEEEAEAAADAAEERAASGLPAEQAAAPQLSHPIVSEGDIAELAFEAAVAAGDEPSATVEPAAEEAPAEVAALIEDGESLPRARTSTRRSGNRRGAREIVIAAEAPPEGEDAAPIAEVTADSTGSEPETQLATDDAPVQEPPETVGDSEATEEQPDRRSASRFMRSYKIQEVIHRRQILLVQVVKEERGNKGAALTTYLSLAGRYCVLMPNSPRGGGVSRKITSLADRKRLREVIKEVDMPRGMGLIVRTAGANRPKPEIRRDCEYLLRLWDDIRDHTFRSTAPALIYEEASLIKRAIRDGFTSDISEVLVDGEAGWKAARDFMRMLAPQHASKVQLWRDGDMSLFAKQQVELQLDAMMSPTVQLKSGGYLVINQAEALVAIDVNSGRSTRERNIEETALRTNLEAADEAARQLRLRDLAGLIVIDFIDMESRKHNAMVERRIKEALKTDRARIQVGQISHFGLLEMSRQRLRPSLAETAFITCPHCLGTGHIRSVESAAVHVLRALDEEAVRKRASELTVHMAGAVAFYILNHKRDRLTAIERTHGVTIILLPDESLIPPQVKIDRTKPYVQSAAAPASGRPVAMSSAVEESESSSYDGAYRENEPMLQVEAAVAAVPVAAILAEAGAAEAAAPQPNAPTGGTGEESPERRRRRRRRRRGGRREDNQLGATQAEGEGNEDDNEGDLDGDEGAAETGGLIAADPTPAPQEPAVPPGLPDPPVPTPGPGPAEPGVPPLPQPPVPGPGPEIPGEPDTGPEIPDPHPAGPEIPGEPDGPGPDIAPPIGPVPEMPQPVALSAEEAPKGRRRAPARSKRVAVEAAATETAVVAPEAPLEVVTKAAPEPAAAEAPARPARRRKAAVAETAPAETAEAPVVEEKPKRRASTRGRAKATEAAPPTESVVETAAAPEPAAPLAAAEDAAPAPAAPVIQPVLIGADAPAGEKRRGWWRR